ncbi:Replication protein A 70 kDa DNA-binding subunit C, partial [Bienertia sinuspersici]
MAARNNNNDDETAARRTREEKLEGPHIKTTLTRGLGTIIVGCNKPYHHNRTCAGELITCFECRGLGHRAADCPTRMSGNGGQVKRFNQGGPRPRNNQVQTGSPNFNRQGGYGGNQGYNRQGNTLPNNPQGTGYNTNQGNQVNRAGNGGL